MDSMIIFVFDNFSLAQFALNVKRIAYINYLFVNITKIDRLEISQIVILTRDWLDFVHPFSNKLSNVCEIYRFLYRHYEKRLKNIIFLPHNIDYVVRVGKTE